FCDRTCLFCAGCETFACDPSLGAHCVSLCTTPPDLCHRNPGVCRFGTCAYPATCAACETCDPATGACTSTCAPCERRDATSGHCVSTCTSPPGPCFLSPGSCPHGDGVCVYPFRCTVCSSCSPSGQCVNSDAGVRCDLDNPCRACDGKGNCVD